MTEEPPKISIIIPAYNEATLLTLCLESIEEQDFRGTYEVIVVDNGSSDRTAGIAKLYGARVISETDKQGPVFARIAGFKAARGEILVSTDADCVLPPDWLSRIARHFQRKRVAGLIMAFEYTTANTVAKRAARLLLPLAIFIDRLSGGHFSGANFAVRREAYEAVGGFDPKFTTFEDVDLSNRLRRAGYKLKIDNSIKVATSARRFGEGFFGTTWKYVLSSYASAVFLKRPYLSGLATVREKPFDITRRFIKHPMLLFGGLVIIGLMVYLSFDPRFSIYSIDRAKTNQKVIALTFDDGPSEPATSQVLSVLAENKVKATFFMVGDNVARHPELAKQVLQQGHVIGNHSDSHSYFMAGPTSRILKNVDEGQQEIYKATGVKPHFYRPPFGFRTFWGGRAIVKAGYTVVTWDDMTTDYWGLSPDRITANIVKHARPGGIIVLHDGQENKTGAKRDNVVAALPEIIQQLQAQGYTFVTLDQLLGQPAYR